MVYIAQIKMPIEVVVFGILACETNVGIYRVVYYIVWSKYKECLWGYEQYHECMLILPFGFQRLFFKPQSQGWDVVCDSKTYTCLGVLMGNTLRWFLLTSTEWNFCIVFFSRRYLRMYIRTLRKYVSFIRYMLYIFVFIGSNMYM